MGQTYKKMGAYIMDIFNFRYHDWFYLGQRPELQEADALAIRFYMPDRFRRDKKYGVDFGAGWTKWNGEGEDGDGDDGEEKEGFIGKLRSLKVEEVD